MIAAMTGSSRALAAVLVSAACAVCAPGVAAADDGLAIGGWLGPRFYSDDSTLGYIDGAPQHPALGNGMMIGFRIGYPIAAWFVPEIELPFAVSSTDILDTTVFWFEPRGHLRFEFLPHNDKVRPFLLLGGGAPVSLSSKNKIFANDVTGEGYFGIGAYALTGRSFRIRADFRVAVTPGVDKTAVLEFEAGLGLTFDLGSRGRKPDRSRDPAGPERENPADPDRDGIAGAADQCADRAEDEDGFEDTDGCPDIDNDLDHVLDIADKCATVAESFNGFEDDDGCPDVVPADLDAIDGTVEGLVYEPGGTALSSAGRKQLKRVGEAMAKYPSVKLVVIGYTDDREALPGGNPAPPPEPPAEGEEPEPDPNAQLSVELSIERAAVIKAVLVGMGIREGRITLAGKGAEDPVGDNETKRGRQANRRVVLKRFVPAAPER
jgi:outer membrane protein OmpA-like peptidoglycan-associated protein